MGVKWERVPGNVIGKGRWKCESRFWIWDHKKSDTPWYITQSKLISYVKSMKNRNPGIFFSQSYTSILSPLSWGFLGSQKKWHMNSFKLVLFKIVNQNAEFCHSMSFFTVTEDNDRPELVHFLYNWRLPVLDVSFLFRLFLFFISSSKLFLSFCISRLRRCTSWGRGIRLSQKGW